MFTLTIIGIILVGSAVVYAVYFNTKVVVSEDHNAVVVNQEGFIKRVLPAGTHHLKPGVEKIEFLFETKTKLAKGRVENIPTAEGILLTIDWSSVYTRNAVLITEKVSQRLRGLPNAENGLQRQVDLALRRLIGTYNLQELFKPAIRERIERQLAQTLKSALQPSGVELIGSNLQAILLPSEVSQAFNQAKAIATLDAAIKASDLATREMVTGAHKMEELLEWEKLFPPYGRYVLSGPSTMQQVPA